MANGKEVLKTINWKFDTNRRNHITSNFISLEVDCTEETVSREADLNELIEAERTFITLRLEVENPIEDLPWRNRDKI